MTEHVRRVQIGSFAALEAGADPGRTAGEADRTPVVFVHGYTGSKEDALPLLERFAAAGHPALAFDQRGMFETPGPVEVASYSLDGWAADTVTVARTWAGRPVHLIGHSFGGFVARAAVIADPSAFASVVLLDSGRDAVGPDSIARHERNVAGLLARGHAGVWDDGEHAGEPAGRTAFLRRRYWATQVGALLAVSDVLRDPPDLVPALVATGVPALAVYGEDEDVWTRSDLDALVAGLGRAAVVIPDAAHCPNEDNPDATAAAMLAFWDGVTH